MKRAMSESGVAPTGARLHVGRVSITLEPAFFVVTGLIGAGFIVAAFADSVRWNRRLRAAGGDALGT